jgi:methylenetetrahydrofolate dehydrogenase (NADP+)/methenyltetrahydrofolate cyclohydrolase
MPAQLIDGKARAERLRTHVAEIVEHSLKKSGIQPGLAVVLVGEDPASQVYVGSKVKLTKEVGMTSFEHRLPENTSEAELLALVHKLNNDEAVDGILVQMPLPSHINTDTIINAIDPAKDVDGLHPVNAGKVLLGKPGLVPCTPQGSILLLKEALGDQLSGTNAVVLGRSILVGKPVSMLLQSENATVTMAHSRTKDVPALCREADILVAAIGKPNFVKGHWIKPGACIIDVGINRIPREDGSGKTRLVGDVDFTEAVEIAGHITPVPGGVGPMTVACLLSNTVRAACMRRGIEVPAF